ncbi:L10-interacting MYB domain-containing protein-like [Papaver somniferum]|uniref:L10-interacting MYB domain-containing protein-like n=1 Tax=Papaver somniferum TaxID=3469 RepID=UPI000E7040D5|nr:L10-interacting MYB domain-containing protein-like [Papaver somniferum]
MDKKEDEKANKITFRSVPEFRGLFIDQCLAQATEYGFSGTSLKQTSWGNLCKFFSEKYDCTITQKKLRNHWDYLRTQYITWSRLLARTGHGYNAETNTFDWSEEQWIELDKTIKNASQFKNKGLEDAEKLQNLFDGKFSTGANRDTPGRVEPPCSAGTSITAGVSNNGSESRTSHGKEKNHEDDNEVDSSLNAKGSGRKRKKEMEEESSDLLTEKVCYIVTSMETHLQHKKLALEKDSAAEFMKALDNLLETDCITMDEYLSITLKASEMPGWQKLFVSLKSDERRVAFIERLQGRGFREGENLNTGNGFLNFRLISTLMIGEELVSGYSIEVWENENAIISTSSFMLVSEET